MAAAQTCTSCGVPLESNAPGGVCPRCLSRGKESDSTDSMAATAVDRTPRPASLAPPDPAALTPHFPQLEILELLGQGGMGMVYKARQPSLDRLVALKILPVEEGKDDSFTERFAREARALAKLSHPNIVAVHDFGRTGPYFYFIMEYLDGGNLRQVIRTQKLSPKEALAIVPKICEALQYAHEEGIMHRDIKPENILLDRRGRVKIADFGLAKLLSGEAAAYTLTQAGAVLGSPRYMAPEQMDRPDQVDHRADIYSLGVVFYEMLTGEVPMGHFELPSKKASVDVRLDEVVLRMLAREPERRYQQVHELKSKVESIAGVIGHLPPSLREAFGYEFRSETKLLGLPLIHIATGVDPSSGQKRVAKGIVAIGDTAKGLLAVGERAVGFVAFGAIGLGVITVAGFSAGLVSFGGLAFALFIAFGGAAAGPISFGGLALGYYVLAGAAFGVHPMGGNARSQAAEQFFQTWGGERMFYALLFLNVALMLAGFAVHFLAMRWVKRYSEARHAAEAVEVKTRS